MSPDTQSPEQIERRSRLIDAVLELAAEGGADAVQLREISRRANVSLRTIYKYFGSRDELLLTAMVQWRMQNSMESVTALKGDDFVERVLSLYRHYFQTYQRQPRLFETYMRMQGELNASNPNMGREAFELALDAELSSFDSEFAADFRMIMGGVLLTGLQLSAQGVFSFEQAWAQIERAVRRLAASSSPSP